MRKLALVLLLLSPAARAETPTLLAGIGGGLDVEPTRRLASNKEEMVTLSSFSFEGELQWTEYGLFARGVGTDGSIDYTSAGFDRLAFELGGTWRPLAPLARGARWRDEVLRRIEIEGGFTIQRAISRGDSGNNFGLHVGLHADLPLTTRPDGRGPFVRMIVQKTITIADDTLTMTALPEETTINVGGQRVDAIYVSAPALQWLGVIGVAF